jgi:hypothetical protein
MLRILGVVLVRPTLWPTAVRQAWRLAPERWWAVPPHLPVPAREYLGFRLQTQYGDISHRPDAEDVVNYLRWCRDWQRFEG